MKKFEEIYSELEQKEKDHLDWIFNRHDVFCNQKYDITLPYSFHLKRVVEETYNHARLCGIDIKLILKIYVPAAAGHDLIEDARLTWNEVKAILGKEVADIIFCCTDCRGKTREDRHSKEFFDELLTNDIAVFVKLCDTIANVKMGLLMNSTMIKRYKNEFSHLKSLLYVKDAKSSNVIRNTVIDRLEILLSL